jgi:hypothetical protein
VTGAIDSYIARRPTVSERSRTMDGCPECEGSSARVNLQGMRPASPDGAKLIRTRADTLPVKSVGYESTLNLEMMRLLSERYGLH